GTSRSIPDSTVRVPRSRRTSDRRTAMSCVGVATGMREGARERGAASCGRNPAQDGQIRLNGAGVDEPRGTGIIAQSGAPLWERLQPRAFRLSLRRGKRSRLKPLPQAPAHPDFFVSRDATTLRHHPHMAASASDFRLYHSNALDVLAALLAEELRAPAPGQPLLAPDKILIPQVAMR